MYMPRGSFHIIFKHIPYYMGRFAKWVTILGAYVVRYMLHTAIKGKVLADFVAKFIESRVDDGKRIVNALMVWASVVAT